MTTMLGAQSAAQNRLQRITVPTLVGGVVVGASVLLHLRDPHETGSWGLCPWLVLTGTSCPGCGGLRAVNDLTRGDLGAAASSNLLFVSAVPLLLFFWGRWFTDRWNAVQRNVDSRRAVWYGAAVLTAAILFAVVRNTPWGDWLAA